MSVNQTYFGPASAAPASAGSAVPTRLAQTEDNYLKRALWFEGYAATMMGTLEVSPEEVAACAITKKATWASSTWRQIKASLLFRYGAMNTPASLAAVQALQSESQGGSVKRSNQTSAKRKKNVSDADLSRVLTPIAHSKSKYAGILQTWLVLGSWTGLRPHEWCQAVVVSLSEADIEGKGDATVKLPYLRVENAKHTNGRGHGKYRHLPLAGFHQDIIDGMANFALHMTLAEQQGQYPTYYAGCQALLARINGKLRHARGKRVQLYSARHKFSAAAKLQLTLAEVGALMGHGTDQTSSSHYGKRQHSSGGLKVTPLAIEVRRVRLKKTALPQFLVTRNSQAATKKGPRGTRGRPRRVPEPQPES